MKLTGLHTQRCIFGLIIVALLPLGSPAYGQSVRNALAPSAKQLFNADAKRCADRALQFLAKQQSADGTFGRNLYGQNVGVGGLAGIAFLSSGSTPGRGRYGVQLNRCVDYSLSHCQDNGFISARHANSHGPMYGHGFATLFLAEVYGMSPRKDLRDKLTKAVQLIIDTQNNQGGWRYQPQRRDADLSVTICQIMALRAAKNSGLFVPKETIDRCLAYVRKSQNADGGFTYTLDGGESAFPRSAAGLVALYSAGVYEGTEIDRGLQYLMKHVPNNRSQIRGTYFFYGHYYGVQAAWHAGGDNWSRWYPAIRDYLLKTQDEKGTWANTICPAYGAAMGAIILQIPNHCVPILQR